MKPNRFELVTLLIVAAILVYQLFVPPLIGLADNGDSVRFLEQRGLSHISTDYGVKYLAYFNSKYRITEASTQPDWYMSSTSLLIALGRRLSITSGQTHFFDIRFMAAFYTLILLFGIWLILLAARSLSLSLRLVLSGLLIIIFTDVGYCAFFNSFYSEGTVLCFLAVGIACSLILLSQRSSSVLPLVGYFLALAMVVTAKPVCAALAPGFALFGIYFTRYLSHPRRYWLSLSLAVLLCCIAVWTYRQIPPTLGWGSAYAGIFMDLLPHSSTPEQDLAALGLNPDWAIFSGINPYQPQSPWNKPAFQAEFFEKIRPYTLPLFYLTRPQRLYELCSRSAKNAFTTRVEYLGYYEASSGKPKLAQAFGLWSSIREWVMPRSLWFLCCFFATGIVAATLLITTRSMTLRGIYLLYILLIFIGAAQFFVAVLAEGEPDLKRHLFTFNLAFDVCLILLVLGAVHLCETFKPSFRHRFLPVSLIKRSL
jgi:hypothetical protein